MESKFWVVTLTVVGSILSGLLLGAYIQATNVNKNCRAVGETRLMDRVYECKLVAIVDGDDRLIIKE